MTFEPTFQGNRIGDEEKLPPMDVSDISDENSTMAARRAEPIVKKKIRNFSDKYDKGKQIG